MQVPKLRKGFTLIELLIVITIIGVLAVALVPRIVGAPAKARDAARLADLQQIATGIELYADSNSGTYPGSGSAQCVSAISSGLIGYLSTVPEDPQGSNNPATGCADGYGYYKLDSGFLLFAALETASNSVNYYYKVTVSDITASSSAAVNLDGLTTCSGTACLEGEADYVIGR